MKFNPKLKLNFFKKKRKKEKHPEAKADKEVKKEKEKEDKKEAKKQETTEASSKAADSKNQEDFLKAIKQEKEIKLKGRAKKKYDEKKIAEEREKLETKFEETKEKETLFEKKKKIDKHLKKDMKKLKRAKGKNIFSKRKKDFSLRGFVRAINLQNFHEKAGLSLDAKNVAKKIFLINVFFCLAISLVLIILTIVFNKGLVNLLILLLGFWLTIFFFLLALTWFVYLFYLDMMIFKRTKAVEEVFPDFLQLTSANISAGMPVDRALWYAVRPGFGVLAKEIELVAKNTIAGEDLSKALVTFANKYNSKIIQRSINLLLEGMSSGGEMADLLNKIALNIEETKILRKEMAASVTTYVIFITFATILAAPVLFGLATQLLEIIKEITMSMGAGITTSGSFFGFSLTSDSIKSTDFRIFAYAMLTISSVSSACIVSVIRKGRVREGLIQIPVFIAVSLIIYTISSVVIRGMFGSLI